jgi:ADP-ribose pyrophosphatase YjhB (NUDIX family)
LSGAGPDWLSWIREIEAIASAGSAASQDPYDRDRYHALLALAARMTGDVPEVRRYRDQPEHGALTDTHPPHSNSLSDRVIQTSGDATSDHDALSLSGFPAATLKIGVRGAVFDEAGRILMVRERVDAGRWTLPGGWAEVNQTPAQSVAREVFEESGYVVRATKLASVWDRGRQNHPAGSFSVVRLFFLCALQGGEARTSLETSEVGWFGEHEIPADLSVARIFPRQIGRMFEHRRNPGLATDFE